MTDLQQSLRKIRPHIQDISPIVGYGTFIFGCFNVLFGLSLFFIDGQFNTDISIVSSLFNYRFWGALFFSSGVSLQYGFLTNRWEMMRRMLLAMIFSKTIWEVALIFRLLFHPHSSTIILLVWTLITLLQFLLYIYFPKGESDV